MSKHIWFIRHGQSVTNAGGNWHDAHSIPLTDKGREQAKAASEALLHEPSLIVTSPYTRTLETAQPTLDRWPSVLHEEWPIHEFTYVCETIMEEPTPREFAKHDQNYWDRQDPHHVTGPKAESFMDFIGRVDNTIDKFQDLQHEHTFFFSHALFMKGLIYRLENQNEELGRRQDFKNIFYENFINNTAIAHFTLFENGSIDLNSISDSHLEDDEDQS